MPEPVFIEKPKCSTEYIGKFRWAKYADGAIQLQAMALDGWGNPFWTILPSVDVDETGNQINK